MSVTAGAVPASIGEPQASTSGIVLKLQGLLNSFRPAERKVADFVISHDRDVVHYSISELADLCGASEATVIRFCRKAGFPGYQSFKITLAQGMVAPLKAIHEDIEDGDDLSTIVKRVFAANVQAIRDSFSIIDISEMGLAVDAILKARRLLLVGVGGSGIVAQDAAHKFMKTGISVVVHADTLMQSMSAALAGEGDVVLGISHHGSTKAVVDALRRAQAAGATTICLTHATKSPITRVADIKLFVTAREVEVRDEATGSRIAQLCVLDSLYVGVANERKPETLEAIKKTREAIAGQRY